MIGTRDCPPPRLLVTVPEAAAMLQVSPRTVWSLLKDGQIPRVTVGRSVRVAITDLMAFIARQKKTESG